MKLPYALFGVFRPPLTFTAHRIVVRTTCVGFHGKAREKLGGNGLHLVPERVGQQHLVPRFTANFQILGEPLEILPYILWPRHGR